VGEVEKPARVARICGKEMRRERGERRERKEENILQALSLLRRGNSEKRNRGGARLSLNSTGPCHKAGDKKVGLSISLGVY
jgi:hypothetical protein